jgi:hypothetical protein
MPSSRFRSRISVLKPPRQSAFGCREIASPKEMLQEIWEKTPQQGDA